jgi:hypothetical protein
VKKKARFERKKSYAWLDRFGLGVGIEHEHEQEHEHEHEHD